MAFSVQSQAEGRVVVLGQPSFQIAGLAHVGLAGRVDEDVDEEGHGSNGSANRNRARTWN